MQQLGLSPTSKTKPESRLREFLWPNLSLLPQIETAIHFATIAGYVIAVTSALMALYGGHYAQLIDSAVFVGLGFGISRKSRVCAVLLLAIYLLSRLAVLGSMGVLEAGLGLGGLVLTIVFTVVFFNGMRATFAFHAHQTAANESGSYETIAYAAFRIRFRAVVIDSVTRVGAFLLGGIAAGVLFENSPLGRVVALVLIVIMILSYEPIMVWRYAGTLGHRAANIRVVQAGTNSNLSLSKALIRSLVKIVFGLFSLVTMFITNRAQSLHDLAAGSVVRIRESRLAVPGDYFVPSRPATSIGASPLRRIAMILVYCFISLLLTAIGHGVLISTDCLELELCSVSEQQTLNIAGYVLLTLWAIFITLGWTGRLPGCR